MEFVESEMVELKSEVVADICKEIIAFANTKGGMLYIGVANDGTVVGVENADYAILQLNNKVRDSIKPDITMFVRNGTATDPASDTAIRKMIKETDGDSYENMRSLEQDLTFTAATEQFVKRKLPFDVSKMRTLGMISGDDIYSNVAMLLSEQCNSTMKAAVFAGLDKSSFQDRREFSGSLFQQMEDMYQYLDMRNQTKATFEGLYRIDVRDYPEDAIREALLNSIVHRDYSFCASTLVSIYDDRIEFVSVGGLPTGIELDDILLGLSVCRNPKLAAIFYRLELIEAYGTGIPKIMNAYNDCDRKPKIEVTNNAFKITLPNRNYKSIEKVVYGQNTSDEGRVLDYLKQHGKAVRSDIDSLLGVSQSTASRILRQMIREDLIYPVGKGKNTQYKKKK